MTKQMTIFNDTILEPERSTGIKETETGFIVSRRDRNTVTVELKDTYLEVRYTQIVPREHWHEDKPPYVLIGSSLYPESCHFPDRQTVVSKFNLFDYYRFSQRIAEGLVQGWQTDKLDKRWVVAWLIRKTGKLWGKDIHSAWRNLIKKAPPDLVAVHKATFAANFGNLCPEPGEFHPSVYTTPYIASDVVNSRAAALVLHNVNDLTHRYVLRKYNHSVSRTESVEYFSSALTRWDAWPMLLTLAPPTRTIMRTLADLPGNVPLSVLQNLAWVDLERPISNRLELLVSLLPGHPGEPPRNTHVFQNATSSKIKAAMAMAGDHLHQSLNPRRIKDVSLFANWLNDYPDAHNGDIMGLTKKTIKWHIHELENERKEILERYTPGTQLATPPIALPDNPKIRLLKTIDDLVNEAELMQHCVLTYTPLAISGRAYLFHVDHAGEHATVEVWHSAHKVNQAKGPKNRPSKAATYGARVLNLWAKGLENTTPIIYGSCEKQTTTRAITDDPLLGSFTVEIPNVTANFLAPDDVIPF